MSAAQQASHDPACSSAAPPGMPKPLLKRGVACMTSLPPTALCPPHPAGITTNYTYLSSQDNFITYAGNRAFISSKAIRVARVREREGGRN